MLHRILEIQRKINTHSQKVAELCGEAAAILQTLSHSAVSGIGVTESHDPQPTAKTRRKRRTRTELKTLIEAAVDTYGAKTTAKLIAEKADIALARIYKEPCATFLEEARKEYQKKQNAERAADYQRKRQQNSNAYD